MKKSSGFTLVEIAVAVAILGLALTTLIGLHTRMLNTYITERNRIRAAFYAQYLMALLETENETPEVGAKEEDLRQALDSAGYFDAGERRAKNDLAGWRIRQSVDSFDLPAVPDALRRVTLTVSWGNTVDDVYSLMYMAPNTQLEQVLGAGIRPPGS